MHCVYLRYRPAHCLIISSLPGKAGWVGAVTTFTLLETNPGSSVRTEQQLQLTAPWPLIFLTLPASSQFTTITHAQMEARTRGPSASPSQISRSTGAPYTPPMEARSVLVQEVKNSHLGGENETTHHIPCGLSSPPFSILLSNTTILHHHPRGHKSTPVSSIVSP